MGHVIVFLLSLVVLVFCADKLVEYGARIARRFGVSDLVIGLTLTSIGTSIPELASSISAALQGNSGFIVGSVVGSNVANIGLIMGVAALIRPFSTERRVYERDGYILLAVSAVFFGIVLDNVIGRWEAFLLVSLYVAYVAFLARSDRDTIQHQFRYFLEFFVSLELVKPLVGRITHPREHQPSPSVDPAQRRAAILEVLAVVLCGFGVVAGARYLVVEASWAATAMGVPEAVIGLSLVAVGTSLPELTVAIAAARRGNPEMVIGNVMGSNLANTLLIFGTSALISPLAVAEISVTVIVPIMLFFTLGLLYVVRSGWAVTRFQGAVALISYASFMAIAFWQGWS
jgi:cation:H+ antiporter